MSCTSTYSGKQNGYSKMVCLRRATGTSTASSIRGVVVGLCLNTLVIYSSIHKSTKQTQHFPDGIPRDLRYHELPHPNITHLPMRSSHYYSTIITNSSSLQFDPMPECFETCCVQRVAVSIDHENNRMINTIDGLDLADVLVRGHKDPTHLKFRSVELTKAIIPCLRNGTIIHIDSYGHSIINFFENMRPNITTSYVLITSDTDGPQPMRKYRDRLLTDNLMLKWYGNNPNDEDRDGSGKFVPLPLGLSKYHPQMPYLDHYLQSRNYINPFRAEYKQHWRISVNLFRPDNNETTDVLFVNFGINKHSKHRSSPWKMACRGRSRNTTDRISCGNSNLIRPTIHETYSAASRYLFGLSPPGNGEDCYRTYEYWFLGIIPVVVDRFGFTGSKISGEAMWDNLPVVVLPNWTLRQEELLETLQNYVMSKTFWETDFETGWERLFLGYWRHRVLRDAGRENDVFIDQHNGKMYYLAHQYKALSSASE